jgi:parvulin-like peptidyl-prolyl isomerase
MRSLVLMGIAVIMMLAGCGNEEVSSIVAQVNDQTLSLDQCKAHFSTQQWNTMTKADKQQFVQKWVEMTTLAQAADASGLTNEPEVQVKLADAQAKIKANALISQRISTIEITEDDLFNYYRIHKSSYQKQIKEYRLQRIFLTSADKLAEVQEAIKNTSFSAAAKKYSEESYSRNGGFVGWVSKGKTDPLIWNAMEELRQYRYKTVETSNGLYVVRFYDQRMTTIEKTFKEVKDSIHQVVLAEKRQNLYQQTLQELMSNADISISL